ncbi:MAG: hydroxyacylglutathione hydrolase [Wigglesworthia glossinidia]|nr:hydroxyacylglutathione hydrolase [Wigglesworthia glossinidia]
MYITNIIAYKDNYIWILYDENKKCLIIDPGEYHSVCNLCIKKKLTPIAILLTHHHYDHVNGVQKLKDIFQIPVYGPEETLTNGTTNIVREGDKLFLLNQLFHVFDLPGHTSGHIGFYVTPWFFSGDTLFSAGCGKLFEGSAREMHSSIKKINTLPPKTLICSGHEYTLQNLKFALSILPDNTALSLYKQQVEMLICHQKPIVPSMLYLERQINVFLNPYNFDFKGKLKSLLLEEEWYIFKTLREMKNNF